MFWYDMMAVRFKFNRILIQSALSGTPEADECQNEARVIKDTQGLV